MKVDVAIINGTIVTMDSNYTIVPKGFVLIRDKKIYSIGPMEEFPTNDYSEIIDVDNHLIMPGFINTHTHLPMVLLRGLGENLALHDWLTLIWKYEAKLTTEDFYLGTIIAGLESIRSGVTCVHDMYLDEFPIGKACEDLGLRAVLSYGMIDLFADNQIEKRESELNITKQLLKKWPAENDLITITIGPHAPFTNSPEILLESTKLARKYNVPIHIHIAETKKEKKDFEAKHGKTSVQYLEDLGFFEGVNVIAAHCVWVTDNDLAIFKKRNVKVAHNPASNMKIGSGIAPIPKMLEAGIPVGLGTDGAASNDNLSMLNDLRLVPYIQKGMHLDPTLISSKEVVSMATIDGARVLGMEDRIGSLEPNKLADMIVFDLNDVNITPSSNPYSLIVYSLKEYNLKHVLINGKFVYKDKKFIDPKKVKRDISSFKKLVDNLNKRVKRNG